LHIFHPGAHAHFPLLHTCPPGHALPQLPQLAESVLVLEQVPLQTTCGEVQLMQLPCEQLAPEGQARPQPPQFFASLDRSTQVLLQALFGLLHFTGVWHLPLAHTCPALQV
jgi:hypothetical protein